MPGLIDAHVHVWTDDRVRYPRAAGELDYPPKHFTPEELFRHTKPAGVIRIVLIQMSFYRFDNSYMLDCIAAHPEVFRGVGVVDMAAPTPDKAMKNLARKGVRGFRIVPGAAPRDWLNTPGMRRAWKCAAEERLAICPLLGPDGLPSLDQMCAKHPDTPVVIDHMARIGINGQIRDSDVRLLCGMAKHLNVKVKVSAFYALGRKKAPYEDLAPAIRQVFEHFGPERLMWASDCPFQVEGGHSYEPSLALVRDKLPFLSAQDKLWMLQKSAESTFFAS